MTEAWDTYNRGLTRNASWVRFTNPTPDTTRRHIFVGNIRGQNSDTVSSQKEYLYNTPRNLPSSDDAETRFAAFFFVKKEKTQQISEGLRLHFFIGLLVSELFSPIGLYPI